MGNPAHARTPAGDPREIVMNMQEAKTNLSKLVKYALEGRPVYIANRGEKQVKLEAMPLIDESTPRARRLGFLNFDFDLDEFNEPLSDEEMGYNDSLEKLLRGEQP